MKRFDSLVHVTEDGSWLNTDQDASPDNLLRELDRARVERACLVGVAGLAPNGIVGQLARQHPDRLVPIAGFDPTPFAEAEPVAVELEKLVADGFRGIKLHPRIGGYGPLDPGVLATIDAAATMQLPVFFCTLFRQGRTRTPDVCDVVDALATRAPRAKIVLLHGGGTRALDLFELVRMHANLVLDLSFSLLRYRGSSFDADVRFLLEHLDRRLVVGSDFPDFTPSEAFERITLLADGVPKSKLSRVLSANLAELFA